MIKKQDTNNNKSFTLIELMVSLGILVIVILAAMGIYIRVIGSRGKTLGQLNIQEQGQYLMGLIVKDIRAGMVDYAGYGGTTDPLEDKLFFLDFSSPQQNQIRYKREAVGTRYVLKRCQAAICRLEDYQTITMTDVTIERLDFYITPDRDPFTAGSTTYQHPRVTIVLKFKSLIERFGPTELVLQQTVPQRYSYKK